MDLADPGLLGKRRFLSLLVGFCVVVLHELRLPSRFVFFSHGSVADGTLRGLGLQREARDNLLGFATGRI